MGRYIDADLLLKEIEESVVFSVRSGVHSPETRGANKIIDRIKAAPSADVVEVRHGHWIEDGEYQVCSVCGEEHHWDEYRATYCEDCGARMDERS